RFMSPLYVSSRLHRSCSFFFFNGTATTEIYTLSLHDALPILGVAGREELVARPPDQVGEGHRADGHDLVLGVIYPTRTARAHWRSEEHTSELQSHLNLVCRLLLEKKKK